MRIDFIQFKKIITQLQETNTLISTSNDTEHCAGQVFLLLYAVVSIIHVYGVNKAIQ